MSYVPPPMSTRTRLLALLQASVARLGGLSRTPKQAEARRRNAEKARQRRADKQVWHYPPPPPLVHPLAKQYTYTVVRGDGMLRFTDVRATKGRRKRTGCHWVNNRTGRISD